MLLHALAVTLFIGALAGPADAAELSDLQRTAQAVVRTGPVGHLARVNDGRTVRTATAGLADRATKRKLRNQDQYEAGSQTKTFMAVLTLQLVSERKVALDAPIERYLPDRIPNGANITVRMLLQQTSGLFNYTDDGPLTGQLLAAPETPVSPERLLHAAFSHPPVFAPGAGWAYSNTNYVIIGKMLEEVTGKSLATLLELRIARPLRLHDTYLADPFPNRTGRGYAHTYLADVGAKPVQYTDTTGWPLSWAGAAGAVVSTAQDLSTFYSGLLAGKVLPALQMRQMRTTVDATHYFGAPSGYGLGIVRTKTSCGTIWGHDGATFGSISATYASADGRRTFAGETNTRPYATDQRDPRRLKFSAALAEAQITGICQMFGKKVSSAGRATGALELNRF
ncbi:serine hydrolase [Kineosporia sp. NBRC 101677]|uniref:serine hydrolase domain-containing protein n=1 Tax=Kineosporia sp. NBRC 101677 TaxID=3032197 RepID=UPI0024A37603|nr:serine hydrolase domain-containing protein [Kineosporia sp. NBRC 101677]GLY14897.1 serine hydrolase [Kineosporia sp. NBRC 101677]